MSKEKALINQIKTIVEQAAPSATVILYGSYAREDYNKQSDIDLLILLDQESVTRADQKRIKYPLYDVEFEVGKIISPIVFSKEEWENRYKNTPFYESVRSEGRVL